MKTHFFQTLSHPRPPEHHGSEIHKSKIPKSKKKSCFFLLFFNALRKSKVKKNPTTKRNHFHTTPSLVPTLQRRWRAAPPAPRKDGPAIRSPFWPRRGKFFWKTAFFAIFPLREVKKVKTEKNPTTKRNHFQTTSSLVPTLQRRWRAAPPAPRKDGPARMSRAQRENFLSFFSMP